MLRADMRTDSKTAPTQSVGGRQHDKDGELFLLMNSNMFKLSLKVSKNLIS